MKYSFSLKHVVKLSLLSAVISILVTGCSPDNDVTQSSKPDQALATTGTTSRPAVAPVGDDTPSPGTPARSEPLIWPGSADRSEERASSADTVDSGDQTVSISGEDWDLYREYTFNNESNVISGSDTATTLEIAKHIRNNPSLRVGISGARKEQVNAVRDALIKAGVADENIQDVDYGDRDIENIDGVAVLFNGQIPGK